MGPGRTGVKGVIRDRAEAESLARMKRGNEIRELNRAMEKASLGGKTWSEEEKERLAMIAAQEGRSAASASRVARNGRYGHLREVGVRSFVQAVEEDRNVWVVVHIYDPVRDSVLLPVMARRHNEDTLHSMCLVVLTAVLVLGSLCYRGRNIISTREGIPIHEISTCTSRCYRIRIVRRFRTQPQQTFIPLNIAFPLSWSCYSSIADTREGRIL